MPSSSQNYSNASTAYRRPYYSSVSSSSDDEIETRFGKDHHPARRGTGNSFPPSSASVNPSSRQSRGRRASSMSSTPTSSRRNSFASGDQRCHSSNASAATDIGIDMSGLSLDPSQGPSVKGPSSFQSRPTTCSQQSTAGNKRPRDETDPDSPVDSLSKRIKRWGENDGSSAAQERRDRYGHQLGLSSCFGQLGKV